MRLAYNQHKEERFFINFYVTFCDHYKIKPNRGCSLSAFKRYLKTPLEKSFYLI